jgi:flagellar protein FlgJ
VDVNGLGAMYLNDFQSGGSLVNRGNNTANNVSDFTELLKKAANTTSNPHSPLPTPHSLSSNIDKTDKLYEQCLELEIFMVKTLISSMRNTIQKSGLIEEGFAGKMYEDMLYDEYAREFTKNAHFGMAEMAYLELTNQRGG